MNDRETEELLRFVREFLSERLDARLLYHDVSHTLDDVVPVADQLAGAVGLNAYDRGILIAAGALHDIGYIEQYENNEDIAAAMAAEILPNHGFSSAEIEIVQTCIRATRFPQRPKGLLQQILCDADLDSLGRPDFFLLSAKLREEICRFRAPIGLRQWFEQQHRFLSEHRYYTDAARSLRDRGKRENIDALGELVGPP